MARRNKQIDRIEPHAQRRPRVLKDRPGAGMHVRPAVRASVGRTVGETMECRKVQALVAGMPQPMLLASTLFLSALTWTAFDAGGLQPSERKLPALTRSAVIFFAAALCDLVMAAVGQRRFALSPFISFSLLPIMMGSHALWQRSRLSRGLRSVYSAPR